MRSSSSARWHSTHPIAAGAALRGREEPREESPQVAAQERRTGDSRRERAGTARDFMRPPLAGQEREHRQDRGADEHEDRRDVPRARERLRSSSGTISTNTPPSPPSARTPSVSPGMPAILAGRYFSAWNIQRKYHSGRMPAGAGANGIGLDAELPREEGRERGEQRRRRRASRPCRAGGSRERSGIVLRASPSRSIARRHAHALPLDEEQVEAEERRRDRRQDRDVEPVEAREGRARHVGAAAQDAREQVTDDRDLRRHVGADLRREVGERVPGQQVAGEAESERQEEQQGARDPGQLARRAVRLQEEDGDGMWTNTTPTKRLAPQEWIERMSQPKGTSVMMNWTLSKASAELGR